MASSVLSFGCSDHTDKNYIALNIVIALYIETVALLNGATSPEVAPFHFAEKVSCISLSGAERTLVVQMGKIGDLTAFWLRYTIYLINTWSSLLFPLQHKVL